MFFSHKASALILAEGQHGLKADCTDVKEQKGEQALPL